MECAIVGLGTCGSCTTFTIKDSVVVEQKGKPVVAIVTEEFEVHGHNVATHLGHGDLKVLVLPYPLEARPEDELRAIADEFYPQVLALLGATVVTLTTEQVEVSADPREQYERALAERWSDGVPMLPATDDAVEALLAATPYPADHALCVLPAEQRRRHGRADRGQRGDGRLRAGRVSRRDRRARGDLGAGVERVRPHDHDVVGVPDAARERSVPRRARYRLPRPAAWAAPRAADR